jgi:hypothetical protein
VCGVGKGASVAAPVVIPSCVDDEGPRNQRFERLKYFKSAIILCEVLGSTQNDTLVCITDLSEQIRPIFAGTLECPFLTPLCNLGMIS